MLSEGVKMFVSIAPGLFGALRKGLGVLWRVLGKPLGGIGRRGRVLGRWMSMGMGSPRLSLRDAFQTLCEGSGASLGLGWVLADKALNQEILSPTPCRVLISTRLQGGFSSRTVTEGVAQRSLFSSLGEGYREGMHLLRSCLRKEFPCEVR